MLNKCNLGHIIKYDEGVWVHMVLVRLQQLLTHGHGMELNGKEALCNEYKDEGCFWSTHTMNVIQSIVGNLLYQLNAYISKQIIIAIGKVYPKLTLQYVV